MLRLEALKTCVGTSVVERDVDVFQNLFRIDHHFWICGTLWVDLPEIVLKRRSNENQSEPSGPQDS